MLDQARYKVIINMIRKWNEFIKESIEVEGLIPGPNEEGSVRLRLDDEEEEMFSSEPALENLISNQKVSLFDNEVWYFSNDKETINILKEYFPEMEEDTLSRVDDEDFDEKPLGWDEEFESLRENKEEGLTSEEVVKILKKELKEFEKDYDIEITVKPKGEKKESYRDKMKRKVADAKKSVESGKRNYRP